MSLFTKPTSAISSQLTSQTVQNAFNAQEKLVYEQYKKEIQKTALKAVKAMAWEFDVNSVSASVIEKLKQKISKRGFSVQHQPGEFSYSDISLAHGGSTNAKLKISLPTTTTIAEDDGYSSDGWNENFKASAIKNLVQECLNKEYLKLSTTIESNILKYPAFQEYFFKSDSISGIVLQWLKEDLEKRGFIVNDTSSSGYSDIGLTHFESSHTWTIKNPLINNYKKMEIYL